jgi:hypothetical protein
MVQLTTYPEGTPIMFAVLAGTSLILGLSYSVPVAAEPPPSAKPTGKAKPPDQKEPIRIDPECLERLLEDYDLKQGKKAAKPARPAKRVLRWSVKFNTKDGNDYLNQLSAFGAILAFPQAEGSEKYLVIRNLKDPTKVTVQDLNSLKDVGIYWVDDNSKTVRSLCQALKTRPASYMVVFFPRDFEKKLYDLERGELDKKHKGAKEDDIGKTTFDIVRVGDTYQVKVRGIALRR